MGVGRYIKLATNLLAFRQITRQAQIILSEASRKTLKNLFYLSVLCENSADGGRQMVLKGIICL